MKRKALAFAGAFLLVAALRGAPGQNPALDPGHRVELVVVEKRNIFDHDLGRARTIEEERRFRGELLSQTENAYHVRAEGEHTPLVFEKVRVKEIRRIDPVVSAGSARESAQSLDAQSAAATWRKMAGQGRYKQAIEETLESLRNPNSPDREATALALREALDAWFSDLEVQATRAMAEEDCARIEQEVQEATAFLQQDAVRILPGELFSRPDMLTRAMSLLADCAMRRVAIMRLEELPRLAPQRAAERKKRDLRELQDRLLQSIQFTENLPSNPRINWAQADIMAYLGDKQEARRFIARAIEVAEKEWAGRPGNPVLVSQLRRFSIQLPSLPTVDDELPEELKPTPVPTPVETAQEPETEPKKAPLSGRFGKIVGQVKATWEKYGKPWLAVARDHPIATGSIVAFIVVFWLVPVLLMRAHVAGGDIRASMYRKKVRTFGLLGYAAYRLLGARKKPLPAGEAPPADGGGGFLARFFSRRAKTKYEHYAGMTCATCGQPIDRVADYALSLKFDACPHCGIAIEPVIEFEEFVRHLIEVASEQAEKTDAMKNKKKRMKAEEMEAQTMARMLNGMYALAVRRRATDIHLQRDQGCGKITYRVDGMLSKPIDVPASTATHFLSAVKIQAGLDITNHTTPQDGRINLKIEGVEFDIRVNCAPTPEGEVIFLRLLDKRNVQISARQLGFQGKNLEAFEDAIHKPHGLILVTGPTGSGKSTTLYVAMNEINTGERNILTIEDPVEYRIEGLKQMQVNPDKSFTFATGLRSILRQDPDVIMVGEIRDHETANMAVEASITGHLVFTTLHTMDTASAISRLSDLGVASQRYASALVLVIAQRLVRLICPECKQPRLPTDAELQKVGLLNYKDKIQFMAGNGCNNCDLSGYYGRRAVLEIMQINERLRNIMADECRPHILRKFARQTGMRILREDAAMKIVSGETTVEEVIRVTS